MSRMEGRGRGRGRGAYGGGIPGAKDDEGKLVSLPAEGPPPLFPEMVLPPVPTDISEVMERQLIRRHELQHFWRTSCFHLSEESVAGGGGTAGAAPPESAQLMSILTLDPAYFPAELFTTKDAMSSKRRDAAAGYWATSSAARSAADVELGKLEELAQRESRLRAGGGREPVSEAEPVEEAEEEEDVADEDDDYFMNQVFDDDDGYEDDYNDGDDGPVY